MIRIIVLTLFLAGCATNKPELKPLPPEKLFDLLHQSESNNVAYKTITKEDYEIKETC